MMMMMTGVFMYLMRSAMIRWEPKLERTSMSQVHKPATNPTQQDAAKETQKSLCDAQDSCSRRAILDESAHIDPQNAQVGFLEWKRQSTAATMAARAI